MKLPMRTLLALLPLLLATPHATAEVTIESLIDDAGLREGPVPMRDVDGWRKPRRIVVSDRWDIAASLQAQHPDVEFVAVGSADAAVTAARDADAVIGWCDARIIDASARLVWAQVGSSGVERCMDTSRIADGSVVLTNMQKMSSPVIGEHAVAMMLSLARGLPQQARRMQSGEWDRRVGDDVGMISVNGKTLLVAGLGGIGTAAARRADGLGMRILATRNSSREGPDFVDYVGLSDELFALAEQADVVINALPLTPETRGLFDAAFFDAVKPGVIFINVARGGSVVTDDLVAALKDGRVLAAGLDVTDPEPLPSGHPLWQMENVIITPHIAWYGSTQERENVLTTENVRRFINGDALLNVVDPERGY
ncbi:MAG: D-2-hydroxyacid dehydrogenase [Woeseiaceae bacterium]|nr:D-2-hydroxyacid dehydrogenase [Woeseiaceae bacterium]